jgi:DNA polymerase V
MPRGGRRAGAGRPLGSGRFGEPSIVMRVPVSRVSNVYDLVQNIYKRPLYQSAVPAGFPSPADSETEEMLDLNERLVKHPAATFFVRVSGSSMIRAGIHHDDILIVDRSLEPVPGKIVVAAINGELTVKRLVKEGEAVQLIAENDGYPPITVSESSDLRIWGVVTTVVHAV